VFNEFKFAEEIKGEAVAAGILPDFAVPALLKGEGAVAAVKFAFDTVKIDAFDVEFGGFGDALPVSKMDAGPFESVGVVAAHKEDNFLGAPDANAGVKGFAVTFGDMPASLKRPGLKAFGKGEEVGFIAACEVLTFGCGCGEAEENG